MRKSMVVGFAFCKGRVLLMKKERPAWQKGRYNGVGGHVEHDECHLHAMVREFEEETGRHVPPENWREFCAVHAHDDSWEVVCFTTELEDIEVQQITDEELKWIESCDLDIYRTIDNLNWLIPMAMAETPVRATVIENREGLL